ncbi:MAG: CDP-alcohol phosphatidyltransferase family protein [Verrucomicrobia bacterium]|nr:CDP-alcohol phosphatidyltransferase family protein [Verrucomicrobiota bacterium]
MSNDNIFRRPLTTRTTKWAGAVAGWLVKRRVQPNTISVLSMAFAALAGGAMIWAGKEGFGARVWLFLFAAAGIQLRLACNMFDGMVAVEGGFKTKSGEIYNELPDRFADVFILAGSGYSMPSSPWLQTLGWMAAALAVITAYVRAMGVAAGAGQYFLGPMAKPHRMATLTVTCLALVGLNIFKSEFDLMQIALIVICAGCLVTIARRLVRIVRDLESK